MSLSFKGYLLFKKKSQTHFSILKKIDCGKSFYANDLISSTSISARQLRIVNGQIAKPHSLPSIVLIQTVIPGVGIGLCDGTLIDARTVLSAAT